MTEVIAGETATRRAQIEVLGVIVAVAVLLSAVGIYGLLAYTVAQRKQEIGVRLALGAEPRRVGLLVLADGLKLALIGIVPGALIAYAAARGMSTLLFGIAASDPITFAAAIGLAALMTIAGAVVPARRAVRVNPISVLRAFRPGEFWRSLQRCPTRSPAADPLRRHAGRVPRAKRHRRVADPHLVAVAKHHRRGDLAAADERAVRAAEILDRRAVAPRVDADAGVTT
jgi:hypothetical protein